MDDEQTVVFINDSVALCKRIDNNMPEEEVVRNVMKGWKPNIARYIGILENRNIDELKKNIQKYEMLEFMITGDSYKSPSEIKQSIITEKINKITKITDEDNIQKLNNKITSIEQNLQNFNEYINFTNSNNQLYNNKQYNKESPYNQYEPNFNHNFQNNHYFMNKQIPTKIFKTIILSWTNNMNPILITTFIIIIHLWINNFKIVIHHKKGITGRIIIKILLILNMKETLETNRITIIATLITIRYKNNSQFSQILTEILTIITQYKTTSKWTKHNTIITRNIATIINIP